MTLDDLTTRAVERGLRLLPCVTCRGSGLWCDSCPDVHGTWPTREASCSCCHDCPACDGTGEDRTSAGVVLAVHMGSHDGTPEGIARTVLTAWLAAVERAP